MSYQGIVTFAGGGCAAVPRIDAETFEEAVSSILLRVHGREVKTVEVTDLTHEDADAA